MFCKVERSYIEDGFNLYGLRACVANFSDCLDLILDRIGPDDSDDSHLTQSACTLYGLIHARYIITAHGLDAMYNKYANKEFGTCPLIQCYGQPVLPVGLKDDMGADTVKIFCPKCSNVYHPPPMRYRNSHGAAALSSASVDGAAFGTTFAHLFLMTFNNLVPDGLPQEAKYVPRVFGFRVHPTSRNRIGNGIVAGGNSLLGLQVSHRNIRNANVNVNAHANAHISANVNVVSTNTTIANANANAASIAAEAANGITLENINAAALAASKSAAVGADGKAKTKGKRSKSKSEDSGGSSKRRTKNGGTGAGDDDQKSKRQKRP